MMAIAIGAIGGSSGYISFLLITEHENVVYANIFSVPSLSYDRD